MTGAIITIFLSAVFSQYLFPEDFVCLDDTTLITKDMVSPTDDVEARNAYNQGTSLMNQNQYKEADVYFLRAIEFDNKYVDAMEHSDFVYRRLERYEEAEKESHLIGDAFYIQGDNYFYKQKYAEALKYYNVALAFNPNNDAIKNRISEAENLVDDTNMAVFEIKKDVL
jgi:tetratricopeptide (TPR) repeat protein